MSQKDPQTQPNAVVAKPATPSVASPTNIEPSKQQQGNLYTIVQHAARQGGARR